MYIIFETSFDWYTQLSLCPLCGSEDSTIKHILELRTLTIEQSLDIWQR